MASSYGRSVEYLSTLLLASSGPLPATLVRALVARADGRVESREVLLGLLRRPELTDTDVEKVEAAAGQALFVGSDIRANIFARQRIRDHDELAQRIATACGNRKDTTVCLVVSLAMDNPCISEGLLDLLATSPDPLVVATYARQTRRGPQDRAAALRRLDDRYAGKRRINGDVAREASTALERLWAEDSQAGREVFLSIRTRGILLALADGRSYAATTAFLDRLDAEARTHLFTVAVRSVLVEEKPSQKDRTAAETLLRHVLADIDLELLRELQETTSQPLGELAAEVRRRSDEGFNRAHRPLSDLALSRHPHDRAAAASWLTATLSDAVDTLGWDAALTLVAQLPDDTPLQQVCDLLAGIAEPGATSPLAS